MKDDEIKQLEKEIDLRNEQLEQFSSTVSHDLRNPLNLAKGYLDLARESGDEEDFEEVEEALERMERIIEDLIFVSRQPEKVQKEQLDLKDTLENIIDEYKEEVNSIKAEEVQIKADNRSMEKLLDNLISNSVKHNDTDVDIQIGTLENGFYYEDNGKGIDPEIKDSIFEYGFSTLDGEKGSGLSVVKRICNAHGWDYSLTDSEEGGIRIEFYRNEDN